MIISAYAFPDFQLSEELKTFSQYYGIEEFVFCQIGEVRNLKPKNERVCRFCGLDYSQTPFESKPHIISELLGNKYLISDFECDRCNNFFGANYENDLTNFLGMSRTFLNVKNKKDKVPEFNSPGYKFIAKRTDFFGVKEGLKISISDSAKDIFHIDRKAGNGEIRYQKQSYTPIRVYKAFLKIALSIIPEIYVADYKYAFDGLFENDERFSSVARILHYELSYNHKVEHPVCFLFKKLEPENRITNHVFAIYFQNQVFEFLIPFCRSDIDNDLYNGIPCSIPLCPPFLFSEPDLNTDYFRIIRDLSSNQRIREEDSIFFSFDPKDINNLKVYDGNTEEEIDEAFNPDEIKHIYIAPYNSKGSFPESQE